MKAIRVMEYGGPDVLRLVDVPEPAPGTGQVLVRLRAAGVNPVETYMRTGTYAIKPPLPWTPGFDGAGDVEAVGDGVAAFRTGDRVYVAMTPNGTYAEKVVADVEHVHRLPHNVSYAQGAALGIPYATAHRALFGRGEARAGETVLIHGASGGVGIAAVQLARAGGLTVIGTAGSSPGAEAVRAAGAHLVLDHGAEDYLDAVRDVNIVIEMLANVHLMRDLDVLAPRGRVVVVGNRGSLELNPRGIMAKDADIRGFVLFNTPPSELRSIHAALFAGLENGTLKPVVAAEFPLAEAAAAHEAVLGPGHKGKLVLAVDV